MALRPSVREVLVGLETEGLVDATSTARAHTTLEGHHRDAGTTPWFVKALAGFGAWVAALFLLSFFACVGLWKEEAALAGLGLALCIGSTFLRRVPRLGVFLEQLALALCIAGAAMAVSGFGMITQDSLVTAVALGAVSVTLLFVFPDAILRFIATLGAAAAVLYLAFELLGGLGLDLAMLGCAVCVHLLLLNQARWTRGRWGALVGPVAFSLASGLLFVLVLRGLHDFAREFGAGVSTGPDAVLTLGLAVLTLYTAWNVLTELGLDPAGRTGVALFVALALLAVVTLHTPGVIAATGLMALGFHRRSAVMLGLAVVFLLGSGATYYYDLGLTLLAKALALLGGGLVMLGLRLFLLRSRPAATASEVR